MRRARTLLSALTAALACRAVAAEPVLAPADAPRLTFRWHAPAGCPPSEVVLGRVERLLGHSPDSGLSSPLAVTASVEQFADDRWELRLESGAPGAEPRRVSAPTCDELGEVAALFTALSVDPTLRAAPAAGFADMNRANSSGNDALATGPEAMGRSSEPPPPVREPASSSARPATLPPASPGAPFRLRPLASGFAALALGRLPGAAVGGGVEVGVGLDRSSVRAVAAFYPERHASSGGGGGGDFWLGTAGARLGYELVTGVPALAVAAGVSLDWVHGNGTGVVNRDDGTALVLRLEPAARIGLPVARALSLFGDAALSLPVNRPRFVLDGTRELYRPPGAGAGFALGVEWRAP